MDAVVFAFGLLLFGVAIFAPPLMIASAMKKRQAAKLRAASDELRHRHG